MKDTTCHITWEFAPFYRRWQGLRYILWYLWPIRWCLIRESDGLKCTDYYLDSNSAAQALARLAYEEGRNDVRQEIHELSSTQ